MSEVEEWNMLLDKMKDVVLWSHGFTTGLERT